LPASAAAPQRIASSPTRRRTKAAEAVAFSGDEELLRRCIREMPRLSALELASLLSDIDPLQLEAGALSAFRQAAQRP